MKMEYRPATAEEMELVWDRTVAEHPDSPRWAEWRIEYIQNHLTGKSLPFLVLDDGVPIGEGTLLLSPECSAVAGRTALCDGGETANVNALRIRKAYEGQGHISRLVREMEACAARRGIRRLTIGVEAKETRNLAIYLHWGYTRFLFSQEEDGELVLYFGKDL